MPDAEIDAFGTDLSDRILREAPGNEAGTQIGNLAPAGAYAAFAECGEPSFTGRWALSHSDPESE